MPRRKKRKHNIVPDAREPNGRTLRPTRAQLEAIEKEQRLKETATVRGQPHRRDLPNPGDHHTLEDPWGSFCVGLNLGRDGGELERAGENYKEMWRSWRLAAGLSCPFGKSSEGMPTGIDQRDPDALWRRIEIAQYAMKAVSKAGALAIDQMCGENRHVPHALWGKALKALRALSLHLGTIAVGRSAGTTAWRGDASFHYGPDPQEAAE